MQQQTNSVVPNSTIYSINQYQCPGDQLGANRQKLSSMNPYRQMLTNPNKCLVHHVNVLSKNAMLASESYDANRDSSLNPSQDSVLPGLMGRPP